LSKEEMGKILDEWKKLGDKHPLSEEIKQASGCGK